jgi:hypothetical protein
VNDGRDIHPIYMNLNTRPNFAKRYAICVSGAADGRGLSDIIVYSEEGESQDELPEDSESVKDGELGKEETETHESFNEVESGEDKASDDEHTSPSPHAVVEDPEDTKNANEPLGTQVQSYESASINETTPEASHNVTAMDNSAPGEDDTAYDGEHENHNARDREDDLIDYSEEELEAPMGQQGTTTNVAKNDGGNSLVQNGTSEYFISPCLKPYTCFCSKCILLIEKEYETINENLEEARRQRSISRSAESAVGQSDETSVIEQEGIQGGAVATGDQFSGEHKDDHNEVGDDSTVAAVENSIEVEEPVYEHDYENESGEYVEEGHELGTDNQDTDPSQLDSANPEGGVLNDEEFHFFEGELDFGANQDSYDLEGDGHVDLPDNAQPIYHSAVGEQDFIDVADSSATVSAGEPYLDENHGEYDDYNGTTGESDVQASDENHNHDVGKHDIPQHAAERETENADEIDYEDGESKTATLVESRPDVSPKANGSSKRSISEVDIDDAVTSRDQG